VTAKSPLAMDVSYYGLSSDPEEQHPRPATDDAGHQFDEHLRAHLAEMDSVRAGLPKGKDGTAELSEETKRQLRALGYLRD